jgi:uncharacterized OsmC-like protein
MKNGISAAALSEFAEEVTADPKQGIAHYGVIVRWQSGLKAQANAVPMTVGGHRVNRDFNWQIDEPRQLGGANHAPNPQEYLLSGLGACIMVAFAVGATVRGIQLSKLHVEVSSTLDLAGFLGARSEAPVPMTRIDYMICVEGDGTAEQYEELRHQAQAHSPNAMSLLNGVPLAGRLRIETAGATAAA